MAASSSPTLKTVTLGCKVNQYETEFVREGLVSAGYADVAEGDTADLCIVNTCTVTHEGDAKSRQIIRRLARENPETRIVVMGCYATRAPDEVAALPNVVEVVTDKRELPDLLGRFGVVDIPTGISRFGNRHRAFLKVQDGCLLRCSYCIIPHVRPNIYSRPKEHIFDEVRRLVDNGYPEIVLTGVHLGHYGVEGNWNKPKEEWLRLSHLMRKIAMLPGDFRIRLSSIEATEVTRELIGVMAEFPSKVAPHLHICLQSGSDAVLRRMRRRWGSRLFIDRCRLLRESLDNPAISTDIIVGFPGETEEDFAESVRVSRESGFSKMHIFPYSRRRGTPAAEMPDTVTAAVKAERIERLTEVGHQLRDDYYRTLLGRKLTVLVEGETVLDAKIIDDGQLRAVGTSCRYAPVAFPTQANCVGKLIEVTAESLSEGTILGRV